jgi:hypothetical protein
MTRQASATTLTLVALLAGGAGVASGQRETGAAATGSWPQWRGPGRDGLISATLPAQWPESLTKRWELAVGAGHSSPVIAGNRVIVLSRQEEQ